MGARLRRRAPPLPGDEQADLRLLHAFLRRRRGQRHGGGGRAEQQGVQGVRQGLRALPARDVADRGAQGRHAAAAHGQGVVAGGADPGRVRRHPRRPPERAHRRGLPRDRGAGAAPLRAAQEGARGRPRRGVRLRDGARRARPDDEPRAAPRDGAARAPLGEGAGALQGRPHGAASRRGGALRAGGVVRPHGEGRARPGRARGQAQLLHPPARVGRVPGGSGRDGAHPRHPEGAREGPARRGGVLREGRGEARRPEGAPGRRGRGGGGACSPTTGSATATASASASSSTSRGASGRRWRRA